jgi:hypothetical protein
MNVGGFLKAIYGDSTGHIAIATKNPETGQLDSQKWLKWPDESAFAERYIEIRANEDVYVSTSIFTGEQRTMADTGAVSRAVWADADTCPPEKFRVPPSIVVRTSEGRYHCWWLLDEEVPAHRAAEVSQRIYHGHKDDGVDSGWNVSKILRVPGTSNTKRGTPEPVVLELFSEDVYTLDTLEAVYSDVEVSHVTGMDAVMPELIEDLTDLEERIADSDYVHLYTDVPPEGVSWYKRLYKFELELFRSGFTPQEVFSLANNAACNKYARDKRSVADLWKDVLKAAAEHEAEYGMPTDVAPRERQPAVFLDEQERSFVEEQDTFIKQYVSWVAGHTDSAETFQHTLAYQLLSCVYGDRAYLVSRHGAVNLNLWALVLADSTVSRKSTARRLYLRALHAFEEAEQIKVDVGNDTTSEALLKELAERDGLVSLLHTDEVNEFFRESYLKNYRVGTLGTFTDLYEGDVPVTLRATKGAGNRKRAKTVFNFLGVGIRSDTATVLTRQNFESGFLARMLWSIADPPPMSAEDEHLDLDDPEMYYHYDNVLDDLVEELVGRASVWPRGGVAKAPVRFTDEAASRLNRWAVDLATYVSNSLDEAGLNAAKDRLKWSVAKAATLLAVHDGEDRVQLKHLLPALWQAERWASDMVRMYLEVSSSDFERICAEVENYIAYGEDRQRPESQVRRKFARLRPQQFDEVVDALRKQGRIRKIAEGRWEAL